MESIKITPGQDRESPAGLFRCRPVTESGHFMLLRYHLLLVMHMCDDKVLGRIAE